MTGTLCQKEIPSSRGLISAEARRQETLGHQEIIRNACPSLRCQHHWQRIHHVACSVLFFVLFESRVLRAFEAFAVP